jgi:plasmid stability protein
MVEGDCHMPTISIPDDTYQRLASRAAASGTTVEAIAVPVLEQLVGTANGHSQPTPSATDWVTDLKAWVQTLPHRSVVVDDSRDSVYGDDGR